MKTVNLLCALTLFGTYSTTLPLSEPSAATKRLFKIVEENPWDLPSIKKALADKADATWVDEEGEGVLHKYLKGIENSDAIAEITVKALIRAGANPFQENTYEGRYTTGYGAYEEDCYGKRTQKSFLTLLKEKKYLSNQHMKSWKGRDQSQMDEYAAQTKKYAELINLTQKYLQEFQEEVPTNDDDTESEHVPH